MPPQPGQPQPPVDLRLPPGPRGPQLVPMQGGTGLGAAMEALLKNPGAAVFEFTDSSRAGKLAVSLAVILLAGLVLFAVAGVDFSQGIQWWAAPLKLTAGLLAAALLCLPSLYIFSCLGGLEIRFKTMVGVLLAGLSLTSLLLAGFTPVVWVFSQSTSSLVFMGAVMILIWVISLYFGLKLLSSGARALGMKSSFHLRIWTGIFVMVTFQMSCALRPLLGQADTFLPTEKKFFVQHWMEQMDAPPPPAPAKTPASTAAPATTFTPSAVPVTR